mmetsp:Transcript_60073/g.95395  ORF Transcript_60073/g.95395 Transcript_60073/m.95395 type:complete len:230 (+) Transcript_60073:433-1122(+)
MRRQKQTRDGGQTQRDNAVYLVCVVATKEEEEHRYELQEGGEQVPLHVIAVVVDEERDWQTPQDVEHQSDENDEEGLFLAERVQIEEHVLHKHGVQNVHHRESERRVQHAEPQHLGELLQLLQDIAVVVEVAQDDLVVDWRNVLVFDAVHHKQDPHRHEVHHNRQHVESDVHRRSTGRRRRCCALLEDDEQIGEQQRDHHGHTDDARREGEIARFLEPKDEHREQHTVV